MLELLLLLVGCGLPDPPIRCDPSVAWNDADGDGFGDRATPGDTCTPGHVENGDDCDDDAANVYPGAVERCNERDDDCDGIAESKSAWYVDGDGDGYGAGMFLEDCGAPDGFVAVSGDCDDDDPDVRPQAPERCNAIDDDCDARIDEDYDADGDGHPTLECMGDDCDDGDPSVYDGARELCGDGRDNDCRDGDVPCGLSGDFAASGATAKIFSSEKYADAARQLEVGDLDADGTLDVLIAAEYANDGRGGVYVAFGPLAGTHDAAAVSAVVHGSGMTVSAGRSLAVGDVNDDGYDDVALGAPESSEAFALLGPVTTALDLAGASVYLHAPIEALLGHGSDIADVDGDGIDDWIVAAFALTSGADHSGSIFVQYGPLSAASVAIVDEHDAELYGSDVDLRAGHYLDAGGDMSGDGIADLVAQAYGADIGAPGGGAVAVVHGPVTGNRDLDRAEAWIVGDKAYVGIGVGVVLGDLDDDGLADVLVGAPNANSEGLMESSGEAYVVSGTITGVIGISDADVVISGTRSGQVGSSIAVDDLDGDGQTELLVGASHDGEKGSALVFYGPMPGTWEDADAAARIVGEHAGDELGGALATADLDADGAVDLLIGAPSESTGADDAGAVYVIPIGHY